MLDLQPYLLLPIQIAGVLIAAALLKRQLGQITLIGATAAVITALLAVMAAPQLWRAVVSMRDAHAQLAAPSGSGDFGRCFVDGGHPELIGFSRWLREHVPGGDPIAVTGVVDYACLQLNVLPHDVRGQGAPARWQAYVGGSLPKNVTGEVRRYAPGLSLVREP